MAPPKTLDETKSRADYINGFDGVSSQS
ncbi:hypothetical protein CCACVL1_17964 [Corchorus capsularis]|uniref:Uncharacterized protein n=1 Tax=Corchorus capsularis TaxID=210143 RepID=A0A1R3HP69_COCAP|nr:hypothetical protein CCACVL1_17964 [Corchorus capsularis]